MLKTNHGWVHAEAPAYAHLAYPRDDIDLPHANFSWRTFFHRAWTARPRRCTHPQASLRWISTVTLTGYSCDNCYRFFPCDTELPFTIDSDPETDELLAALHEGLSR